MHNANSSSILQAFNITNHQGRTAGWVTDSPSSSSSDSSTIAGTVYPVTILVPTMFLRTFLLPRQILPSTAFSKPTALSYLPLLRHTSTITTPPSQSQLTPPPSPPQIQQQQQPQDLSTLKRLHASLLHQPPWYTTIHIHRTPYLVTLGDRITLPSLLYPPRSPSNPLNKPLQPGDIIRLTHASTLGSREYTIKGTPYIDERLFSCKAVVVEVTSEPMRVKEKTKRRQRRVKKVKSKHRYTVLRICELGVNELPEM